MERGLPPRALGLDLTRTVFAVNHNHSDSLVDIPPRHVRALPLARVSLASDSPTRPSWPTRDGGVCPPLRRPRGQCHLLRGLDGPGHPPSPRCPVSSSPGSPRHPRHLPPHRPHLPRRPRGKGSGPRGGDRWESPPFTAGVAKPLPPEVCSGEPLLPPPAETATDAADRSRSPPQPPPPGGAASAPPLTPTTLPRHPVCWEWCWVRGSA